MLARDHGFACYINFIDFTVLGHFQNGRQNSSFNLRKNTSLIHCLGGFFQKIYAVAADYHDMFGQVCLRKGIIHGPALRPIAYFQISELGLGFDSRNDYFGISVHFDIVVFIFPIKHKGVIVCVN